MSATPLRMATPPPDAPVRDVDYWRALALANAERLQIAEQQAQALRDAADEARGRFSKYKGRLDAAQSRINELQIALTATTAERDQLRARVARQDVLRRTVHAFRQSILDGPIWDVFAELCNDVSAAAGGETDDHAKTHATTDATT